MKKIIIFLFGIVLCGCATKIPLSSQDAKSIQNIKLDPQISMPEEMFFNADGAQYTAAFGLIGAVIRANIASKDVNIIQSLASRNNIFLEKIVLSKMAMHINNLTPYKVNGRASNTFMKLKILEYGFVSRFTNKLIPLIRLQGQVYCGDKLICQDEASVTYLTNSIPSYSMKEVLFNPMLLNHMWQSVVSEASKKLTCKLLKPY